MDTTTALPLSAAQRGVWAAQFLDPGRCRHVVAGYTEIDAPVDPAALRLAWRRLIEDCDALRLRGVAADGTAWRLGPAADADDFASIDFSDMADPAAAAHYWMAADLRRPTDLANGPLTDATLLRLAEDRFFFYQRFHHSVADAQTSVLVASRLAELYSAAVAGREPRDSGFGALGDLIAEDAAYRDSEQYAADEAHWTTQFADRPLPSRLATRATKLPADQAHGSPQRVRAVGLIADDQVRVLRDLARAHRTAWPTVMAAVVAAYLARMTASAEVVVGLPVSGRATAAARRTPGMASNTVPLRIQVPSGASLAELLGPVDEELRTALRHQRYRHEDLCRALGLAGGEFGLLGAMVNLMPPNPPTPWAGCPAPVRNLSAGPALDLTFGVGTPVAGVGAEIMFDANPDYFTAAETEAHRDRFLRFVEAAADDPDRAVTRLPLVAPKERRTIVEDWNDTAGRVDRPFVAEAVAQHASSAPDAVAVVDGDRSLTYAELYEQARATARGLTARGIGPEDRVAIVLPRSAELIVAMLGVMLAGAAYVPVDPEYPAERRDLLIADCDPRWVIDTIDTTGMTGTTDTADGGGKAGGEEGRALLLPQYPAYVVYTSGSTGRPKGVVVTHAGLANLVADHAVRLGFGPRSRVLQFVSPSFDAAVADVWPALASGSRLVLAPASRSLTGEYLHRYLAEQRITHAALPPVVVATLPDVPLPDLGVLVVGGAACPADVAARWSAGRMMVNAYGPTEATVTATASAPLRGELAPPIGRPIRNVRVYVLDEELNPVPPGCAGHLYIAGAGLARGYLGAPGATADKFRPCPFDSGHGPGERMYRTGDLARWDADGTLEYLGRADNQIKVRGFRIEPGEIEALLTGGGTVATALVVAAPGGTGVYAYVVPRAGAVVDPVALRRRAAAALPDFMVPAAVVVLDVLPMTPNGKVDVAALPAPEFGDADPGADSGGAVPATGVEAALCRIFADVLGVERFGADASFFEHGGDSITALQVVSAARAAGLELTPTEVFRLRTPRDLAAVAGVRADVDVRRGARGAGGGGSEVDPCGPVALTPAVAWFGEVTGWRRGMAGFNQSVLVRTPDGADLESLGSALQAVLDHHDALRAVLVRSEAETPPEPPALSIRPAGAVEASRCLERVDVAGFDDAALLAAIEQATVRCREDLEPASGSMMRAVWFDGGAGQPGRLLLMAHHLVVDGVSWRILIPDLAAAWAAVRAGKAPKLPPVGTSLRSWAHQLATAATDPAVRSETAFWARVAATDDPRLADRDLDPEVDTAESAAHLTIELGVEDSVRVLTEVPAAFHAGPDDVLLAAFAVAVGRWRRERVREAGSAVLIDLEGHGRQDVGGRADLSRTVGWFTSMYPVCVDPGSGAELAQAVKLVKEQLRAVPRRGIGYGLLHRLAPERGPAGPAPRFAFNYLGRFAADPDAEWGLERDRRRPGSGADPGMPMAHEIEVNALAYQERQGPVLNAVLSWPSGLFTEAEVQALADLWVAELRRLAAAVGSPGFGGRTPSDLPLVRLTGEQVERIERDHPGVEDVWPLTPVQEGLLGQTLLAADGQDAYVARLTLDLEGPLDVPRLRRAAKELVKLHPALRAAFGWDYGASPVQVVCADVEPGWEEADLSEVVSGAEGAEPERAAALEDFGARITARPFAIAAPPLIRFAVLRLGADRHRILVVNHHLLWDGWSTPVLVADLFALYAGRAPVSSGSPSPASWLAWLAEQDRDTAVKAWSRALAGLSEPTLVAPFAADAVPGRHAQVRTELPEAVSRRISALAASGGLTLNTVAQGAWAVVLAGMTGSDDVVFGTSVSGRPPELPGIERAVGMFTNTVPVRVRLDPGESAARMLARLREEQTELLAYGHAGLAEIRRAAGPAATFDTTLLCANYPFDTAALDSLLGSELRLTAMDGDDGTHFPLRLAVLPGERIRLWLGYRPDVFCEAEAEGVLRDVARVFEDLAADPERVVDGLGREPGAAEFDDVSVWSGYEDLEMEPVAAGAAAIPGGEGVKR
ncbi:MAG: amino acid adenylation domain-containing protein [Catenulispora sp.]|nr:amino acid adenylation domain-containing protein [Catenulispora sp.]